MTKVYEKLKAHVEPGDRSYMLELSYDEMAELVESLDEKVRIEKNFAELIQMKKNVVRSFKFLKDNYTRVEDIQRIDGKIRVLERTVEQLEAILNGEVF